MTRRAFFAVPLLALFARPRAYKLQAIAAAHLPHTRTIHSDDPRVAQHFAQGGLFEIREHAGGSQLILFDSLEARWTTLPTGPQAHSIAIYRPA